MSPWQWIESLALARWLREATWAYPLLEWAHLVGLATLFGTLLLVDLRVLAVRPRWSTDDLARIALPWTIAGFALAAASGVLMFSTRANDLVHNTVFLAKLGLIVLAGVNAAWFHARRSWTKRDRVARVQAALSLATWIGVIGLGRFIAYV